MWSPLELLKARTTRRSQWITQEIAPQTLPGKRIRIAQIVLEVSNNKWKYKLEQTERPTMWVRRLRTTMQMKTSLSAFWKNNKSLSRKEKNMKQIKSKMIRTQIRYLSTWHSRWVSTWAGSTGTMSNQSSKVTVSRARRRRQNPKSSRTTKKLILSPRATASSLTKRSSRCGRLCWTSTNRPRSGLPTSSRPSTDSRRKETSISRTAGGSYVTWWPCQCWRGIQRSRLSSTQRLRTRKTSRAIFPPPQV